MTPTEQEKWYGVYENLPEMEKSLIDGAYKEARRVLNWDARFVPLLDGDERTEELIAFLTKHYMAGLVTNT